MVIRKKKKGPGGTDRWQAAPNDAIRLAALRWFALTIEKEGIELYATNTATFPEMEKILRKALGEIDELRDRFALADENCPEGYIRCDDDVCRPSCDHIGSESDDE